MQQQRKKIAEVVIMVIFVLGFSNFMFTQITAPERMKKKNESNATESDIQEEKIRVRQIADLLELDTETVIPKKGDSVATIWKEG